MNNIQDSIIRKAFRKAKLTQHYSNCNKHLEVRYIIEQYLVICHLHHETYCAGFPR